MGHKSVYGFKYAKPNNVFKLNEYRVLYET